MDGLPAELRQRRPPENPARVVAVLPEVVEVPSPLRDLGDPRGGIEHRQGVPVEGVISGTGEPRCRRLVLLPYPFQRAGAFDVLEPQVGVRLGRRLLGWRTPADGRRAGPDRKEQGREDAGRESFSHRRAHIVNNLRNVERFMVRSVRDSM